MFGKLSALCKHEHNAEHITIINFLDLDLAHQSIILVVVIQQETGHESQILKTLGYHLQVSFPIRHEILLYNLFH